jgi:1-acyl-sn-glycerol-3-phosphate acyltransferase
MKTADTVTRMLVPIARQLGTRLFDLEFTGFEHLPDGGPLLVAANHFSHVDPVFVSACAGRSIRYLGVDELFGRSRFFDAITGFFGAIPLSRERAPLGAMRTALEALEGGETVGLYPEGKRVAAWGDVTPPKRGAAWLAFASGAPLVPIALVGSDATMSVHNHMLRRASIRVAAGPPLFWYDFVDFEDPLGAMMAAWEAWMNEALQPWYQGWNR